MVPSHPPLGKVRNTGIDQKRRYRIDDLRAIEIEVDARRRAEKNVGEKFIGSAFGENLRKQIAAPSNGRSGQLDFWIAFLKGLPDHPQISDRVARIDRDLPFFFSALDEIVPFLQRGRTASGC